MSVVKRFNQKYCILGAVALAAGLATQAKATLSYQISDAGLETANVTFDGTGYNGILAGGIGVTSTGGGTPSSFVSVCTDFLGSLYLGNTYTYNSPVSITTPGLTGIDPTWGEDNANATPGHTDQTSATLGLDNAAELFSKNISILTSGTTDQKAALQLAIWTALYDTTVTGSIDDLTGRFLIGNGTTADSDAYAFLSGLINPTSPSYTAPSVGILVPSPASAANGSGNPDGAPPQELLVTIPTPTPVPEASTVITGTLLLLSFGLCSMKSFSKARN